MSTSPIGRSLPRHSFSEVPVGAPLDAVAEDVAHIFSENIETAYITSAPASLVERVHIISREEESVLITSRSKNPITPAMLAAAIKTLRKTVRVTATLLNPAQAAAAAQAARHAQNPQQIQADANQIPTDEALNANIKVVPHLAKEGLKLSILGTSDVRSTDEKFQATDKVFDAYTQIRNKIAPEAKDFVLSFTRDTARWVDNEGKMHIVDLKAEWRNPEFAALKEVYDEVKKTIFSYCKCAPPSTKEGVYSFMDATAEIGSLTRSSVALGRNFIEEEQQADKLLAELQKVDIWHRLDEPRKNRLRERLRLLQRLSQHLIRDIGERISTIDRERALTLTPGQGDRRHELDQQRKELLAFKERIKALDFFAIGVALTAHLLKNNPDQPIDADTQILNTVQRAMTEYEEVPGSSIITRLKRAFKDLFSSQTVKEKSAEYALKIMGLLSEDSQCPREYYLDACQRKGITPKAPSLESAIVKDIISRGNNANYEPSLDNYTKYYITNPLTGENEAELARKTRRLFN